MFALPFCSAATDRPYTDKTPITQSNNIVDISGVGLKQFWDLKGHLQDASTLATAHYPETLDRIFVSFRVSTQSPELTIQVVGAPSFFPTVWSWVKRWFDPITVSKIFVLSDADVLPTLSAFMDIEDIPKKYGGKLDYNFGQPPNLGTGGMGALVEWAEGRENGILPQGTIVWERAENGDMEMVNTGSVDGVEKREVLGRVKRSWEEVMFPGRKATPVENGTSTDGSDGDAATVVAEESGIPASKTVPSAPTSAGPPVTASA